MNPHWKRWGVRILKLVLACLVLFFIGSQFARDLRKLDIRQMEWRPEWLVASGGLYLVAMFPYAWFWRHLLNRFGYPIGLYPAVRAHYIAQIGKYVPGKALAILIRCALVHPSGVPYGVSIISSFYEVFTGMAAGALVAALIYVVEPPVVPGLEWHPLWTGVVLIGVCGIPLMPAVFNFIVARLSAKFQTVEKYRLPPVRFGTLATGLLFAIVGWWLQGLSWWALLQAVLPDPPELSLSWWARCTASIAFANVAGFVIVFVPTGLGVREYLLLNLLRSSVPEASTAYLAAASILLRLVWIAAEALFALATYGLKPAGAPSEPAGSKPQEQTPLP